MKKSLKVVLCFLVAVFLIVGIPLIINECYKTNCGYTTVWNGADLLGYYGSILGAVIAVVTLVATVLFTKKQIQRESYLDYENQKWDRLDRVFIEILDSINPIKILQDVMNSGYNDPSVAINHLQKYQMRCKIVNDQLNAHLNISDYPKFKDLIDKTADISERFIQISQEAINQYSDLRLWKHRNTAIETLKMEKQHPGSFNKEDIDFNKDVIDRTKDISFSIIDEKIKLINEKIIKTYESDYRKLLQLKGSTFEITRSETSKQADNILSWRRK